MKSGIDRNRDVENAVKTYLLENPDIGAALSEGVINVTRLSTIIARRSGSLNAVSVRAALNRIRTSYPPGSVREKPDMLLKKSKISLQDKVSVIKSETQLRIKYISATYLGNSIVYIIDDMAQKTPIPPDGVIVDRNVSMIHIQSPSEIESTPGFVMRITGKLFGRGINILQLISCSNETILILKKEECIRAYEILSS